MVGLPISKQEIVSLKTDVSATIKEPGKAETATPVSYDVKRYKSKYSIDILIK